ncbi:unnamed protein product, partial [Ilex paraguariensis]
MAPQLLICTSYQKSATTLGQHGANQSRFYRAFSIHWRFQQRSITITEERWETI